MRKIFIYTLLSLVCLTTQAQKEMNLWHFGTYAGLNFNNLVTAEGFTDVPEAIKGFVTTDEGCFTLSDADGNLIMSSSGFQIMNRNNKIMPNSIGIHGGVSSTQSGIVIPMPGSPNKYYVVTVGQAYTSTVEGGINYSVVDMALDGGLGAVVATQKNILLKPGPVYENIAAVRHPNGKDYWLVHRTGRTFYVWTVTSSGFSSTPQTYASTNIPLCEGTATPFYTGIIRFSPDNTKLIAAGASCKNLISANFDVATGAISDIRSNAKFPNEPYFVEFSPNAEWVYVTDQPKESMKISYANLRANGTPVSMGLDPYYERLTAVQLGPDKKIYGIRWSSRDLFRIENPDEGGTIITKFPTYLAALGKLALPTFAGSFFMAKIDNKFICSNHNSNYRVSIDVSGTPPATIVWNWGDGTPNTTQNIIAGQSHYIQSHTYTTVGEKVITITAYTAAGTARPSSTVNIKVEPCDLQTNPVIRVNLANSREQ